MEKVWFSHMGYIVLFYFCTTVYIIQYNWKNNFQVQVITSGVLIIDVNENIVSKQ